MWQTTIFSGNYFDVTRDDVNFYLISNSGIVILDDGLKELSYFTLNNITNCFTENNQSFLYISTSGYGVYTFSKNSQYEEYSNEYLHSYRTYPEIASNIVYDIHKKNQYIGIATASGVSIIYNNMTYNSQLTSEINKILVTDYGIYYNTDTSFYYKNLEVEDTWIENYKITTTGIPKISGTILDFDIVTIGNTNIVSILTTVTGIVLIEDRNNISNSSVLNITSLCSGGYDNIKLDSNLDLVNNTLIGSCLVYGISGLRSINLENLSSIDTLYYPYLFNNNISGYVET